MSRTIFCHFYKKKAEGLDFLVYPGELGARIYDEISKQAWNEWLSRQTMLINEKKLTMLDPAHRKHLENAMITFLFKQSNLSIEQPVSPPNRL